RLHATLDTLGERLREAVAHAVSQAVAEAVRAAVRALLADVHERPAAPGPPRLAAYRRPSMWDDPDEHTWPEQPTAPYRPADEDGDAENASPAPPPARRASPVVRGSRALAWAAGRRPGGCGAAPASGLCW